MAQVYDPHHLLEGNRQPPFTKARRDRCVKQIIEETGIGEYEATIAYRIATNGLVGKYGVVEDKLNG